MSYQYVIKAAKKIEGALEKKGATGKGLQEKTSSIESVLDKDLVSKIRFLASVRNKLVHEDKYELTDDDLTRFKEANEFVCNRLAEERLENEMFAKLLESRDCLISCPICNKDVIPKLMFSGDLPTQSYCVFCGGIIKKFRNPYSFQHSLYSGIWRFLKVVMLIIGYSFFFFFLLILNLKGF